jgi:hypothetical protein
MAKFLAGVAFGLLTLGLVSVAWAAEAVGVGAGGGGEALGYLGGASSLGGMSIVGYLLIRYLPNRDKAADDKDKAVMAALKEKDQTVIALIEKKDEQVMAALEKKDAMWSKLLEQNDKSWQERFGGLEGEIERLRSTSGKLRTALLTALGKPGMTALGVPAMRNGDDRD